MTGFRYDPFNQPAKTIETAEQQRVYFRLLVQSLESRCLGAVPLSNDFESAVDMYYYAQEALRRSGQNLLLLKYKKHLDEYAAIMHTGT